MDIYIKPHFVLAFSRNGGFVLRIGNLLVMCSASSTPLLPQYPYGYFDVYWGENFPKGHIIGLK